MIPTILITSYISISLVFFVILGISVYKKFRSESVDVESEMRWAMGVMRAHKEELLVRINRVQLSQDVSQKDHDAMLQTLQIIARSMLDIKGIAEDFSKKPPGGGIKTFISTLEYARDTFANTASQKKAVENIISKVRTSYAVESK